VAPPLPARAASVIAALLGISAPLPAAEIARTDVTHQDRRYQVSFEVLLDAPVERVWPPLSDYRQLARLSDRVIESRVVRREPLRVYLVLRPCILIFCRSIRRTVDVQVVAHGHILSLADARHGDFRYSLERWQIEPAGPRTRLRYTGEVEPRFFVPPVIGPWLIKKVVRDELTTTARKLEALARQ
jgi:hypothetical protein